MCTETNENDQTSNKLQLLYYIVTYFLIETLQKMTVNFKPHFEQQQRKEKFTLKIQKII